MKHVILSLCMTSVILLQAEAITQKDIPLTISRSGTYSLESDVTYKGTGAAITIACDTVHLNLGSHTLTLTHEGATGIKVQGLYTPSHISLEEGTITNTSTVPLKGIGIHSTKAKNIALKNITTSNHATGLKIEDSNTVHSSGCQFTGSSSEGALVRASSGTLFEETTFQGNNVSLTYDKKSTDAKVIQCSFSEPGTVHLSADEITGLLIKDSSFLSTSSTQLVQIGQWLDTASNDVRIEGSSFSALNSAKDGITFSNGSGLIIDSCIIDVGGACNSGEIATNVLVSPGASNALIRNCTIQGQGVDKQGAFRLGIWATGGSSQVVIENCQVRKVNTGIYLGGTGCTVRSCNVSDTTRDGILIGGHANSINATQVSNAGGYGIASDNTSGGSTHSLVGNTIFSNGNGGITLSAISAAVLDNVVSGAEHTSKPTDGIVLDKDSQNITVERNTVFSNSGVGIKDKGTANLLKENTLYANKGGNLSH